MTHSPEVVQLRSKIANSKRWHADKPEIADNLRRDMRAQVLEERIQRVVSEFPPLTDEQRDRLAVLLRPAA